ncbi:hypothetical protein ASE01_16545 [Nocardioides sp. Root190]|uniref:hypothetical protein n=1 Tax=Nocardioides sp. Root190 TaxID=1736488 RepID=UPI0006F630A8|nr:hypothetical protein [Nocardioides sp. Root190]KRB74981.1 hypothetical protein ASE01_16545 [Nocardioides sp. Root190]
MTSPDRYAWLTGLLPVTGCVTVVGGVAPPELARLFGADPDQPVAEEDLDLDVAAFNAVTGGAIAVEPNGYEGTRSEVLLPASLVATGERVASVYWNENVGVSFTCAEAGREVASVELPPYDEDDLADLPEDLRALARPHLDSDEVDPVALGAAMVEAYTGLGFGEHDLDLAVLVQINPLPDVVGADTTGTTRLAREYPRLVEEIERWSPVRQRALVAWVLRRSLATAGVLEDPDFSAVLDCIGVLAPDPLPERSRSRFAAIDRAVSAESSKDRPHDWSGSEGTSDPEWEDIVARLQAMEPEEGLADLGDDVLGSDDDTFSEGRFRAGNLLQWAAGVARAALHPDPATSAWRSLHAAMMTMQAAGRVHGGPHHASFTADLLEQFLPDSPAAILTPKPDPVDAAADLPTHLQRELVEWAARFYAEVAGVAEDADFAAVLSQFGSGRRPHLPPGTVARFSRIHEELRTAYEQADHRGRSTAAFDDVALLAEVAEVVERACEGDMARSAAFVVGSAEMTLSQIEIATGQDRTEEFWGGLQRFGIVR